MQHAGCAMMGHTQHRMQLYVPSSHQQQEAERPEDRCQARGPCRGRTPALRALLAAKGSARPRFMMGPVGAHSTVSTRRSGAACTTPSRRPTYSAPNRPSRGNSPVGAACANQLPPPVAVSPSSSTRPCRRRRTRARHDAHTVASTAHSIQRRRPACARRSRLRLRVIPTGLFTPRAEHCTFKPKMIAAATPSAAPTKTAKPPSGYEETVRRLRQAAQEEPAAARVRSRGSGRAPTVSQRWVVALIVAEGGAAARGRAAFALRLVRGEEAAARTGARPPLPR